MTTAELDTAVGGLLFETIEPLVEVAAVTAFGKGAGCGEQGAEQDGGGQYSHGKTLL
ncbi:MAG: hypothetical protein R3E95_07590 [Thiolinea sp.]